MKNRFKPAFLIILSALLVSCVILAFRRNEPLTKEQAIQLAEEFIIVNGYTNFPGDKSKISFELLDESNADNVMKHIQNTLQPKAFCISEDKDRWNIGFLSVDTDVSKLDSEKLNSDLSRRAVIVMKTGNEVRMAHKDPLFSHFERIDQ